MLFFLTAYIHSLTHAASSVLPETSDVGSIVAFDNTPRGWEVCCPTRIILGRLSDFYRRQFNFVHWFNHFKSPCYD